MRCPESIEELQELEKLIPLCRRTLFDQVQARIESGAAKTVSEASRQLGEETGRSSESIRRRVNEEQSVRPAQLSEIAGTDKHRPHVSQNTGDNEWYTPPEHIKAVCSVMGGIDTDPASSEMANKTVGAKTFFTQEQNGLSQEWTGRVFLNPPYAHPLISQFVKKIIEKYESKEISQAIILVNNATETLWFKELIDFARAVVFTTGRIKFLDPQGNPGAPLQGQAFIYFGDSPNKFLSEFQKFGWGALL